MTRQQASELVDDLAGDLLFAAEHCLDTWQLSSRCTRAEFSARVQELSTAMAEAAVRDTAPLNFTA